MCIRDRCLARCQRLDIDDEFDQGAARRRRGAFEGGGEIACVTDALAVETECLGKLDEVGVGKVRRGDATGKGPLLVHPDSAVAAIVENQNDGRGAGLARGRASSWQFIWMSPSPAKQTTVRAGASSLAAMAAGRP